MAVEILNNHELKEYIDKLCIPCGKFENNSPMEDKQSKRKEGHHKPDSENKKVKRVQIQTPQTPNAQKAEKMRG